MNLFHAIRVDGAFSAVRVRSVPRQTKPYPKLAKVVETQPTFDLRNVRGTIVGFRCPYFAKGANVPGFHFHFISDDRTRGGHVLELTVKQATVSIDTIPNFALALPQGGSFLGYDFHGDTIRELEKVEKGR